MKRFFIGNSLLLQVRSRSLTQLDALSSSMLDTGEHHLESDSSQQQPHHLHHPQQPHQLQHPLGIECNRIRFLAPSAASVEIVHPNRTRHKLSRSQVKLKFSHYYNLTRDSSLGVDKVAIIVDAISL